MIGTIITVAITAVVAFVAGILVGRNNPTEAAAIAKVADKVKDKAIDAVNKVKSR